MGKSDSQIVISSDKLDSFDKNFQFEKVANNNLLEIRDDLTTSQITLQKRIKVERKPHAGFDHIFQEEIFGSIDAIDMVFDNGSRFMSSHQVLIGGFDKAKDELKIIQNLVIAANGPTKIAAEYGAFLLKYLQVFNTVKILEGHEVSKKSLEKISYAGYLTLSQDGDSRSLVKGVRTAGGLGISTINVVNVEDSPVTRATAELGDYDVASLGLPGDNQLMKS